MPPAKSVLWVAATLLSALLAERAIYGLGWYNKYLEPESSAGSVELPMYWLKRFRPKQGQEVAVVGDSRIAEGFSALKAHEQFGGRDVTFWNVGVPGSSPRIWYYMLRDADPTRRRFRAIVFALDYFNDEDQYDDQASHLTDLNYLMGRLRLADAWDFSSSMRTREDQRAAFIGTVLKGTIHRNDVLALFQNLRTRVASSKDNREKGLEYVNSYPGNSGDLRGLTADWDKRELRFPPGISAERQHSIKEMLMPNLPPNTGATTRYRRLWLGRVLELYEGSPTRIVFVETPRGPLPQPERKSPQTFLNWARTQPNVTVLDQKAFRDLETPETYFDGFHLNQKGREIFSARLAKMLAGVL